LVFKLYFLLNKDLKKIKKECQDLESWICFTIKSIKVSVAFAVPLCGLHANCNGYKILFVVNIT